MRPSHFMLLLVALASAIPALAQSIPEPQKTGVSFYLPEGDSQGIELELQTVKPKMVHGMAYFELSPERSPVRISETRPKFIVKLAVPPNPQSDVLMILDSKGGKRASYFTVERGLAIPLAGKQVQFEFRKVGQSSYTFRPVTPLPAGEYGFGFGVSSLAYLFGIEQGATASAEDNGPPAAEASKPDDPNQERLNKLDSLLAKGLITKADYDARKQEILHPAPPKPVTAEDRLNKLNELLKKGLIEKPDYDKKRAEILSEM